MKNKFIAYIRVFINMGISYTLLMFLFWGVNKLLNVLSDGRIAQFFSALSIYSILFFAFFFSLMMFSNYVLTSKNIIITDKNEEKRRIIDMMIKFRWKLKTQTDSELVFIAPIWQGPLRDELSYSFIEREVRIVGPIYIIDRVVSKLRYVLTKDKTYDM